MLNRKEKYYRAIVIMWMLVSLWAAITHLFIPMIISRNWNWGFHEGMQREIALWNIGFLVIATQTFRIGATVSRIILPGIVTLSTLFAINHALSGNWGGVLLNLPPLVLALAVRLFIKD